MRLSSSTISSSPSTFLLHLLFPSQQHLRTTSLVFSRCVADRDAHTSWPCSGHRHLSGSLTCNVLVFHLVRCAAGCSPHSEQGQDSSSTRAAGGDRHSRAGHRSDQGCGEQGLLLLPKALFCGLSSLLFNSLPPPILQICTSHFVEGGK